MLSDIKRYDSWRPTLPRQAWSTIITSYQNEVDCKGIKQRGIATDWTYHHNRQYPHTALGRMIIANDKEVKTALSDPPLTATS